MANVTNIVQPALKMAAMHLLEAQVAAHGMRSEHIQKAPLKDSVAMHMTKFRNNPPNSP